MKKICFMLGFFLVLLSMGGLASCVQLSEDPNIEWRNLTWAVGAPLPTAEDFAVSLPQNTTVRFAREYQFTRMGDYDLELEVVTQSGRKEQVQVQLRLIADTEAPVILGARDLVSYVGEGIAYRTAITLQDNCDCEIMLDVDSSSVNIQKAGVYFVTYTATDAVGNVSTKQVEVYVYEEKITLEDLNLEVDKVIDRIVSKDGSKAL